MTWEDAVVRELTDAVQRRAEDTRAAWTSGEVPDTLRDAVAADLEAVQFGAPESEEWRGGREAWLDGAAEAAAHFAGRDARWEVDEIVVLPRSEDEAAVSYRVTNSVGDRVSRALFLETWARRDGRWVMVRHTGELAG